MKNVRILIVDDHKMVRDGIRSMLEFQENKFKFFIYEAENGEDGVEFASQNPYDIIIMDYQLPGIDGADAVKLIMENNPDSKILALSNYNEYMYIDRMMKNGVKGFVLKNVTPEELIKAIETILNGSNYFSNDVAIKLLNFSQRDPFGESSSATPPTIKMSPEQQKLLEGLSSRETEVLKLIGKGNSNEEIALALNISKRTVESHKRHLYEKLRIEGSLALTRYAIKLYQE